MTWDGEEKRKCRFEGLSQQTSDGVGCGKSTPKAKTVR